MSVDDWSCADRALASLEAGISSAATSAEWADGYRAALADARRILHGGVEARRFEVSGNAFPAFAVLAMSQHEAVRSVVAFAKAAISRDRVGPLFVVRDPLEREQGIEVVRTLSVGAVDDGASNPGATVRAHPAANPGSRPYLRVVEGDAG